MKALLSAKLPDGDPPAIEEILLGLSSRAHLEIDNLVISDGEAPMAER